MVVQIVEESFVLLLLAHLSDFLGGGFDKFFEQLVVLGKVVGFDDTVDVGHVVAIVVAVVAQNVLGLLFAVLGYVCQNLVGNKVGDVHTAWIGVVQFCNKLQLAKFVDKKLLVYYHCAKRLDKGCIYHAVSILDIVGTVGVSYCYGAVVHRVDFCVGVVVLQLFEHRLIQHFVVLFVV